MESQARESKDKDEQISVAKKMKRVQIENQRRLLTCFSFPQICLIQKANMGELGSFFKRLSFQKEKQVVSLFLDRRDTHRLEKVQLLVRLQEKYKDRFHFLVVDSADLTHIFPHISYTYPELAIFDVFTFLKSDQVLRRTGSRPYSKHFLANMSEYLQSFEALDREVLAYLEGHTSPIYLDHETVV